MRVEEERGLELRTIDITKGGLNIAVRGAFKAHSVRWCWNRDSRMRGLRVCVLLSGVNGVTLPLQLLSPHWNCERRM
jgi:hypothetical protein